MRKRILIGLIVTALVVSLVLFASKRYADSRFYEGYVAGDSTEYTVVEARDESGYRRETFTFIGAEGERVPAIAAYPLEGEGPFPCVVMLYGSGQKMTFIDDVAEYFAESGVVLIMPEQYTRGERAVDDSNAAAEFLATRTRARLTAHDARRLVDTVAPRADIDEDRMYLWGLSLGAMIGAPTLAQEPRFKAGVFTVGGGDLRTLFGAHELSENAIVNRIGLTAVLSISRPLDPNWYIGDVSPRPILFQNALRDDVIVREASESLHRAAKDPKEIVWYDCTHEGWGDNEESLLPQMMRDGIAWLLALSEVEAEQVPA